MQPRHQQQNAHGDQQHGGDGAEDIGVEAHGEAHGRDEQADGGEGNGETDGQRERAQPMLARRRAENDGQQRQHARRKHREAAGKKRKAESPDGHEVAP